ncbi:hypothetical protein P7C70_g5533, partial [Phenoliferia sp. Uapishka_3]
MAVEGSEPPVQPTPEASAAATLAAVANSVTAPAVLPSPVPAIPNPLPPGYNKGADEKIRFLRAVGPTDLRKLQHARRPRPISLKTDVIKSRNRSKGKSTSKDRAGTSGGLTGAKGSKERSESTSRSQEDGKNGRKSAPGGSEMEEDELDSDSYSKDGKVRRVAAPPGAYPGPWPYGAYPHPHAAHPHAHQPYPPPRSRSRSSSSSRRAQSLDSRPAYPGQPGGQSGQHMGNPYGYPPPGSHYPPPPEGYPYYSGYPGYGSYPGFYPPPPGQPYGPLGSQQHPVQQHPSQQHSHLAAQHAMSHPPAITHAQSDSRSRSDSPANSKTASPRGSASPPQSSPGFAQYYPHPNPNYPHQASHPTQQQQHAPYYQSPLSHSDKSPAYANGSTSNQRGMAPNGKASASASTSDPRSVEQAPAYGHGPNGRVTLAPIQFGPPGTSPVQAHAVTPGVEERRVSLPSIGSVASTSHRAEQHSPPAVPRHTALFADRLPPNAVGASDPKPSPERARRASVSSNSASISDSSDGVRSPEANGRVPLPWGVATSWAAEDERRGRPERRYDDVEGGKGKGRENEVDELADDTTDLPHHDNMRMGGVDTGFGELRLGDQYSVGGSPGIAERIGASDSSRSRSSGGRDGRESDRGRGRSAVGALRGRSQSTSRARTDGRSSSSSSNRPMVGVTAEAEVARLKTKVAELTFLNSLMQSRLGQLEGPGRVPLTPMSGLVSTPRPIPEDESMMEDDDEGKLDAEGEDELTKYGVQATDPQVRASLLSFFKGQHSGGIVN